MIESSGETFQSSKKSDEKPNDAFASQFAIQKAVAEVNASDGQSTPIKSAPITWGLRRTLRYLYYLAGPFAPFRGIHICLAQVGLERLLNETFEQALKIIGADPKSPYLACFTTLLIRILALPISLAWVHYIISHDPSISFRPRRRLPLSLSRLLSLDGLLLLARQIPLPRLPSRSAVRAMIIPTIIAASLQELWSVLPQSLIYTWVLQPVLETKKQNASSSSDPPSKTAILLASAYFVEVTAVKVLSFIIYQLARVLLTRVQASLLPEDAQSVVPFDRAFGLKPRVGSSAVQGITLLEAWKTLPWSTVWRLCKLHVKIWCLAICVGFIEVIVVGMAAVLTHAHEMHVKKAV